MHNSVKLMIVIAATALIAALAVMCGCSTPNPTAQYPCPQMLDPVTEETPNVIQ